jgi:hypothetical protein
MHLTNCAPDYRGRYFVCDEMSAYRAGPVRNLWHTSLTHCRAQRLSLGTVIAARHAPRDVHLEDVNG